MVFGGTRRRGLNLAPMSEDGSLFLSPSTTKPLSAQARGGSYSNALPGAEKSYSNAPSRCSGASICSFLGTQCSAPVNGCFSFMRDCFRASAAQSRIKETPPLIAGVRCIGRSYRNRTYTMGVRGPCATTTPSSNARFCSSRPCGLFVSIVIIAHNFAFCNRFRQQY